MTRHFTLKSVLAHVLILSLLLPQRLLAPVFAQEPPTSVEEELSRLKGEVQKNRETTQLLFMLLSQSTLDVETKKKVEAELRKKAEEAQARLEKPVDSFGTPDGDKLRNQLAELAKKATSVQITQATEKAKVMEMINAIEEGKRLIIAERQKAMELYHKAVSDAPIATRNALASPTLTAEKLATLGVEELRKAAKILNPALTEEFLQGCDAKKLAEEVFTTYTNKGVPTPELLAALGEDVLKRLAPQLANSGVVQAAKTLVDVHRAGADFAAVAVPIMQAAIQTGNPYVIAAAAVIVALIALFKFVFGKGGGGSGGEGEGDGKGDSQGDKEQDGPGGDKGAGSEGRNTGAGDPSRQPGDSQPQQGGSIALGDGGSVVVDGEAAVGNTQDGKFLVTKKDDTLYVRNAEAGPNSAILFELDLTKVTDQSRPAGLTGAKVTTVTSVAESHDAVSLDAGRPLDLLRRGDKWVVAKSIIGEKGYTYDITNNVIHAYKDGKQLHKIPVTDIQLDNNGTYVDAKLTSVTQIRSFSGDKILVEVTKDGAQIQGVLLKSGGKWLLYDEASASSEK